MTAWDIAVIGGELPEALPPRYWAQRAQVILIEKGGVTASKGLR